jgi:DNA-binding SARP family transcriptional activator
MVIRLLGALDIDTGNGRVTVPAGKPRSLLVLLALHPNEPVGSDQIVDALWVETPPVSAQAIVQTYISRLRKALGDGRIETVGHGYRLTLADGERDIDHVEALRNRAGDEHPRQAAQTLQEALELFRGQPLADVAREEFAQSELRRLEELRATLLVERLDAEIRAGRHADVLAELEGLVASRPLDERVRGLLIIALYRSGRQADALTAYQDARRTLKDDLGLEPSQELRDLQRKVLEHDPSLGAPAESGVRVFARRRRPLLVATALIVVVLAAVAVAGALEFRDPGPTAPPVSPNTVAIIDPQSLEVVASVPVGRRPTLVAATPGAVWVASVGDRVLTRIDPRTFETLGTVGLGFEPTAIEPVGDALWVAGGYDHALWRVDRDGLARVKLTFRERYALPEGFERGPAGLASSTHGLWLSHGVEVTLLDPVTGRAKRDARIGGPWGRAIEIAGTRGLVASERGVQTFNPKTLELGPLVSPIFDQRRPESQDGIESARFVTEILSTPEPAPWATPERSILIAWRPGQLWGLTEGRLLLMGTVQVGDQLVGVARLDGAVWTISRGGTTQIDASPQPILQRIDEADLSVETVELAHTVEDIAAANGFIWLAVR